jgi:hypothetical protein
MLLLSPGNRRPLDPGVIKHRDDIPDEIDGTVGRGVMRLVLLAMAPQIDQHDLPAMGKARVEPPKLAPELASFAAT